MSAGFEATLRALTGGETPRVWSLLVTVFGDLGQGPEAQFSGALLGRLTQTIGIKPEATRVALHRLRKEGWITSTRTGRHSDHAVTPWGQLQIMTASPLIYARATLVDRAFLILTEPGTPDPDGIVLRPGVTLSPRAVADGSFCQEVMPGAPLPAWMQARICPPETVDLAARSLAQLRAGRAALPDPVHVTPLQTAALRVLIVHAWRRVALRAPMLPDALLPRGFAGPACRTVTMEMLDRLPAPTRDALEAAANPTRVA